MFRRLFSSSAPESEMHLALGALATLVFLGLEIYSVVRSGAFDMEAFGIGIAALFAATGSAGVLSGAQRKIQGDQQQ